MNFADRLKNNDEKVENEKTYTLEEIQKAINMSNAAIVATEMPGIDLPVKLMMVAILNNYAEILKMFLKDGD